MITVYTIGVYNSTEEEFFKKLLHNEIDLFCDIRQRRGVRGAKYRFVNSKYLQDRLKELNIDYRYLKELAPTNDIRQKQKDADIENGESKKDRQHLSHVFKTEYTNKILNDFDMDALLEKIDASDHKRVVFFCVEEFAPACHRSLVANRIAEISHCDIIDL